MGTSRTQLALRAGAYRDDLVHDLHTLDHVAEDRVAPAIVVGVEAHVVGHVDEELRIGGVRIVGARHRDGPAHVAHAVAGLVGNARVVFLEFESGREAAGLRHEARDDAVEYEPVVKAAVHEFQEVPDRDRRELALEFELDVAHRRLDQDVGMRRHLVGRERQAAGEREGQRNHDLPHADNPRSGISRAATIALFRGNSK